MLPPIMAKLSAFEHFGNYEHFGVSSLTGKRGKEDNDTTIKSHGIWF